MVAVPSSVPVVPKAVIASPSEQADERRAKASRFGFSPACRLRKTEEFSSVFAFRRIIRGRFCSLHWRPNGQAGARLGVVAAKRLARRAHTRNLVKRIARERFRLLRAGLPAHDLIVRLHTSLDAVPRAKVRARLRADLDALYGRLSAVR